MEIKRINLDVSSVCNAKCEFCTHTKYPLPAKHLNLDHFESLDWQNIPELDTIILCGIAGEPTAHPDFLRLVKFIKILDKHIILITNGTFRTALWWQELCTIMDSEDEIIFGLDGTTKETHEMYRGTNFDSLIMNIKVVTGVKKTISYIVFLHNEHQISDGRELSKELGCDIMFRKSSEYNDRLKVPTVRPPLDKKNYHIRGCYADIAEASIDLDGGIHYCCYSYVNFITGRVNTLKFWKTFSDFKKGSQLYDTYRKKMKICNDCFPHRPLTYNTVKNVDLALTSSCNISCKFCQRSFEEKLPKNWKNVELDFDILKREFIPEFLNQLKVVAVCGSLGDPVLYSKFDRLMNLFNDYAKHCRIYIHTNGTMRDTTFWKTLGRQSRESRIQVQFAIDGADEKRYLQYRKGSNWKTLFKNIDAFTDAGGKAVFQFIIFKHNEHQVDAINKLSKQYGAIMKYQTSYYYDNDLQKPECYARDAGKTVCHSLDLKQISVDHEGFVTPCCHTRPFKLYYSWKNLVELYEKEKHLLDLHTSTIEQALNTEFFKMFWTQNENINLCQNSCFKNRRYGVNKIG